jgi:hypothetical protein
MSIPTHLVREQERLRRERRGTWRWWFGRGAASSLLTLLHYVNGAGRWSWPMVLGYGLACLSLCWLVSLVVESERRRIEKKRYSGPLGGGWSWAVSGYMGFAVYQMTSPGSWTHAQGAMSLLVFSLFCMALEYTESAKQAGFDLLEAREQALRAKLAPHFIFNTLNTLHAQIEQDPRGAQATTERLAQLFRQVIEASDQAVIPLKQELAFVEAYLGIEQARLGGRLRVVVGIPEELESAQVPPLSVQVLVENAIKHGVAPLERGGEVRLGAERKEGVLHVWVEDPGQGLSAHRGTGTALETLRQRLESPEDLDMGMVEGRHRVGFLWRQA